MIPVIYNVRSLMVRKTTTFASVLGIALVVFVLAAALMLSEGIKRTLGKSGAADVAIVLRKGNDAELSSTIDDPQVGLILSAPGVKKDAKGQPLGVGETLVVLALDKVGTTGISNVQFRGVTDNVMDFRGETRLIDGRPLKPGSEEAMIGKRLRGRFKGMELGQKIELRKNHPATIVGVFEDGGSSFESEVWIDRDTLRAAFGRQGSVSSVRIKLEQPSQYESFAAFVGQDKQLGLESFRESDYYAKQSEGTSDFISIIGKLIAFFFGVGAMIGAMITMHASVADRQREIGTLRAIGFSRSGILFSFLLEALLLAMAGGVIGGAVSLSMGFVKFSMLNLQSWSEIVFSFTPTSAILIRSLFWAGVMGFFGGLFPAIRAARISPVEAMRG